MNRPPDVRKELAELRKVPRLPAAVAADRFAQWRKLLRQSTTQGRAVLQRILRGRLKFTPIGRGYKFEGQTRFDRLFSGLMVGPAPAWVKEDDRRGREDFDPIEDTFDGDYGRLLEAAQSRISGAAAAGYGARGKGVRARRDSNPLPPGSKSYHSRLSWSVMSHHAP